jgi:cell division protein FtsB
VSKKRKRKSKKNLRLVYFVVLFFCIIVGIRSFTLFKESRELNKKQEILTAKMESEEQRKKDLEELEKYMKTKKFMEETAKAKLHLVYPDEILIEPENK